MGNIIASLNCASGTAYGEKYIVQEQKRNMFKKRDVVPLERELFQKYQECFSLMEKLDSHDKEALERSQVPLAVLEGDKSKDIKSDAKEDTIDQHNFDEMKGMIENFLRHLQKTGHSYPSFEVFRFAMKMYKQELGEDKIASYDMNNRSAHGQLENNLKGHKSNKENLIPMLKHQNKTTKVENGHENDEPVQILFTHDGNTMHEIVQELQQMLTRRIGPVKFINLKRKSEVDENMLMIIVCIVNTRVGADASNAVDYIKNLDNVALLLMHNTEAHAVSNKNSRLVLTGPEFKNLQSIFDMSFNKEHGFFQCDMNEKSIDGLSSFCKRSPYSETL